MDDPYAFLHQARREPGKERVPVRIRHWREYIQPMSDRQLTIQASRCMDCATPYCHRYCPVHNLIPEWNTLIGDEHWRRAYEQLDSTNNFPELTGRLCPAPCEHACTLQLTENPVTIKSIECAIADRAWQQGWVRPRRYRQAHRQRVAVIGSGPAGLACAQQLVRAGYKVSVLEKADRVGGLLRYGIPDFRLQKSVLNRRLEQLEAEGVRFRTGVHVGVTLEPKTLLQSAEAVVLACGTEQARDVRVSGRDLRGVHYALDYLTQQNHRTAGDHIEPEAEILATGKEVVVIGGGDTGCDCVGTAIRQGARQVTQIQYHEQPPPQADLLQYWPKPVPVLRSTDTEAEGCKRLWGWNTVGFEEDQGQVCAVRLQRLEWSRRRDGSYEKWPLPNRLQRLPAQLVLVAIGYAHPVHAGLLEQIPVRLDVRGNVAANDKDYQTSEAGVFACGDMRRGQSLIVWAIREGRQCARAVDLWLSGSSELPRV